MAQSLFLSSFLSERSGNTETFYFKRLIDLRKQLNIHPMIDIRLWEKTEEHKDVSFPKNLVKFAQEQKECLTNEFDKERDRMVIVFDGDIFEEKVQGYEDLINEIEKTDIAAVTNPGFELFLLLHIKNSYVDYIKGHESEFMEKDKDGKYGHAYQVLREITGKNAKKNKDIGDLAENILIAIEQEKRINQDIHDIKGTVSSNVGAIIESIMNEKPDL